MSQQQNKKYKEQQMKILALKNTITKIKKSKNGINGGNGKKW